MALSTSSVLEVRTGGNDTNGGGFVTGAAGTDYSQQNSKNTVGSDISVTDGVTAGTTTVTSLTANFGTTIVGNIIYISGGTGSITGGWYQVTARASATSITVDRSTGLTAGTGVTINIGGALLSPAIASSIMNANGMIAYVKNDGSVFSATSASANVAAGVMNMTSCTMLVGYQTTRTINNTDTGPTFQLNVASATFCTGGGMYSNIIFDGNSQTSCKLNGGNNSCFLVCTFKNFNVASSGTQPTFIRCLMTTCSASVITGSVTPYVAYCEAYANTATPFLMTGAGFLIGCLSYSNTGGTTDGFSIAAGNPNGLVINCTAYNNGRDGFRATGSSNALHIFENCYAQDNAGFGLTGTLLTIVNNCGFFNNNSGGAQTSGITQPNGYAFGTISPTADVFTNKAGNIFSLNNSASAGAVLRSVSLPTMFPRGLTANYMDVNAARHIDPSGAGMLFVPNLEGT